MADIKIDELKAKAWAADVNSKLKVVRRELEKVKGLSTLPDQDPTDTVFQLMYKVQNTMDDVWTNTCNVFEKGWGALEEGLDTFKKAGNEIGSVFDELVNRIR